MFGVTKGGLPDTMHHVTKSRNEINTRRSQSVFDLSLRKFFSLLHFDLSKLYTRQGYSKTARIRLVSDLESKRLPKKNCSSISELRVGVEKLTIAPITFW